MKRKAVKYSRSVIATVLALLLAVQSLSGSWGTSEVNADNGDGIPVCSLENNGAGINLENAATELYVGSDWAGTAATVQEEGSKAVLDVTNYGWNGEWGIQYLVKELDVTDNTPYTLEFDILSSIDKKVMVKLDDSGLITETLDLKAGEPYHFSQEAPTGTFTDKTLYFAIGQMSGETPGLSGTLEIDNLVITGDGSGEVETAVEIAVNKKGSKVTFQQAADDTIDSATVYYQIFDSEEEANRADVDGFPGYPMAKKSNGIWETAFDTALQSGQVIQYRFNVVKSGVGALSAASNYIFEPFNPKDYTVDTKDRNAEGYDLVWNDEFEGTELDRNKWSFQIGTKDPNNGPEYWGNQEKQYYTDQNHQVTDGKLVITAKKENKEGMPYTSTRIRTVTDDGDTLFAARYGRIEARMKLPAEDGLWPAFWMLPEDSGIYGTWAASGEIDIMEARGRVPGEVGGTLHYGSQWPNNTYGGKTYNFDTDTTDIGGYHLYSVEWSPGKITWLVDDVPYGSMTNFYSRGENNADNYTYGAPFDVPFYIILNLAVGGTYDGDANLENATFPTSMEVDYVRVFQKTEGYQDDNLAEPEMDKDTAAFNSEAFRPSGADGDYIADTKFATLKNVAEVNPEDTDWQFFVGDFGGAATQKIDTIDGTKYAKIDISAAGNQNYAIQMIKHLPFAEGYTYEISFDAKSSGDRNIIIKPCGDGDNGWAGYGQSYEAALTTEVQHYTHQFTMDKSSDATARLEFDLGLNSSSVWIGNVVVKKVEKAEADNTDMNKIPLGDGSQIYNGTFDQGPGRVGFWHFNNVTVNVPSLVGEHDYSRRAILTADGTDPRIYQKGMELLQSDQYRFTMDLSSETDTEFYVMFTSKDGSQVYMKKPFTYSAADGIKKYTSNFAMPKGITDKEGVFVLGLTDGTTVSVDNINLVRTTKNNVTVDYSDIDLEPIKKDSADWAGHDQNNGDPGFTNKNGELSIETATADINYQRMLFHPVSVKNGITYKLSFKAKSDKGETYEMSVQEDNSWAEILHETIETATLWKDYEFTFTSTLTNDGNPINLKYLLSGPKISQGKFYVKDVSMAAVVEEGGRDAPEKTAVGNAKVKAGTDYTIQTAKGDWRQSFMETAAAKGKAVIMVDELPFTDYVSLTDIINADAGTITIPGAYLKKADKTHRIELALSGYNNVVLKVLTVGADPDDKDKIPDDKPDNEATIEVKSQPGVPIIKILNTIESLMEIVPFTKEEKKEIADNAVLKFLLEVENKNSTISQKEKELVAEEIEESLQGYQVGQYLDITFKKELDGRTAAIEELNGMLGLEVQIPTEWKSEDDSGKREFAVIRIHNGKATVLKDMDDKEDTITIETDRFSTYAFAYKDNTASGTAANKVKTGDNAPIAQWMLVISFGAVVMAAAARKRIR